MPQTHRRGFWIEHLLDQVWPRRLLGVHQNWAFRKPLKDIGVGLLNPFLSSPFSLVNLFLFIASSPINWGMYILHALILEVLILKGYKLWITGCHELPQSVLFFLYFLFPSLFSFHDFYDPKMKSLKYDSFYFSTTTWLYFIYLFIFLRTNSSTSHDLVPFLSFFLYNYFRTLRHWQVVFKVKRAKIQDLAPQSYCS